MNRERQSPGRLFFLLAAKERTKENCRCFDAADPRLGGCTPPRPPKRKSEGAGAKRKQYYFSFLTPPPLPPPLSRVLRGCERGATVERSETGERAMFAPAGQTTARACLRSKLAALVVRRQAPPNPRCRKQQSVGAGHARPAALPLPPLYFCIVGRGLDPSAGRPRRPAASRHTPSPGNQHPAPTKGALSCDTSKNCSAC